MKRVFKRISHLLLPKGLDVMKQRSASLHRSHTLPVFVDLRRALFTLLHTLRESPSVESSSGNSCDKPNMPAVSGTLSRGPTNVESTRQIGELLHLHCPSTLGHTIAPNILGRYHKNATPE